MTITILSEALKNGHQLPVQLPRLRDRLIYHEYHSGGRILNNILVQEPVLRSDLTGAKEKFSHSVVEAEVEGYHSASDDESNRKTPDPDHAFESDVGFEFDQLKLDVLLVRIFLGQLDYCSHYCFWIRMSNCPSTALVRIFLYLNYFTF